MDLPRYAEVLDAEAVKILHEAPGSITLPTSHNASNSISVPNSSYMLVENMDNTAVEVNIPVLLNSPDTLRFLEIEQSHAIRIWKDYEANISLEHVRDDYDLLRAIKDYTTHRPCLSGDCGGEDGDWYGFLAMIGMDSTFVERVMDPEYAHMRLMFTAKQITRMYFEERWLFLQGISARIRDPEKKFGQRTIPVSKVPEAAGGSITSVGTGPIDMPGHKTLYKSGSQARLEKIIDNDGALNFSHTASSGKGDFHPAYGFYFTTQYAMAFEYAKWTHQVLDGNVIPVAILRVAVPDNLLASAYNIVDDEWRDFVYTNRNDISGRKKDFAHLKHFEWWFGPCCHTSQQKFDNKKVARKEDVEVWILPSGECATQYFTNNHTDMIYLLSKECRGKVWISTLVM